MATTTRPSADLFFPLNEFYSCDHHALPLIERISPDAMPEPYKTLLVHTGDMTPTLERYHGGRISLKLYDRRLAEDDTLSRRVALVLDATSTPVEFGAIRIYLSLFSDDARRHILEGVRPLGTILNEDGIDHQSRPYAFLRVLSDDVINEPLGLTTPSFLYGRRNVLFNQHNEPLAEVVEILPPITQPAGNNGSPR